MGFAGDQPNRDNIDFTPVGSAPSNASEGATIYHTASGLIFYTGVEWVAASGGGSASLSGLTDTTLTAPASGEILEYNGSAWLNATAGGGGSLSGLSDTTTTAPASGEFLQYDGSTWANAAATTAITSGYVSKLIASGSVSAGTSFDTPSISGTTYSNVRVEISNIDVSTDLYLYMVAVNSDSTEQTGASDYGSHTDGGSATFAYGLGDSTSNRIRLGYDSAGAMHNTGDDGKAYTILEYINPQEHLGAPTTTPALFTFEMSNIRTDGAMGVFDGAGFFDPSATGNAVDKLRVKSSAGNFTCTYKVFADVQLDVLVANAAEVTALSDLSDTTTTAPASGEILSYDGSTWANTSLSGVPTSGYYWKLLESKSATTAGTSVSFTGLEDYSATELRITGKGLALDNTDADYKIEMLLGGTDDVVNTGASDYMRSNWNLFNTTSSNAGDFADNSIIINTTTAEAGGALEVMDFDCKITGIESANYAFVNIEGISVHNNSTAPNVFNVKARHNVLEELGVVQILHQDVADVWTGGTFDLWGLVPIEVLVTGATDQLTTLDAMTDTTLTAPASGEILEYNGSDWVNAAAAGAAEADTYVWKLARSGSVSATNLITLTQMSPTGSTADLTDAKEARFIMTNIDLVADGTIRLLTGTDSQLDNGSTDYGYSCITSGYGDVYDSNHSSFRLWNDGSTLIDSTANGEGMVDIRFMNPINGSSPLMIRAECGFLSHNTAQYRTTMSNGSWQKNGSPVQWGGFQIGSYTSSAYTTGTNFNSGDWEFWVLVPA